MAKHIGIVGCSAEGAALCYRTLCLEAQGYMGEHMHPEITMHTFPLGDYLPAIKQDDHTAIAELMLSSARKLAGAGADFLICPDNTIHESFDIVEARSPLPWLHIADAVGEAAHSHGYQLLGLTGTRYLMTGPVYPERLKRHGIKCIIPSEVDRGKINAIIFSELVNGIVTESSRLFFNDVIEIFKSQDCTAAILGCTEIPLLVDPGDCPLPVLDSTRLLARAALKRALI
jgi:aspartate racemase